MNILHQILNFVNPVAIKCNDTHKQQKNSQSSTSFQEQNSHDTDRKICSLQQLNIPIQFVTHPQTIKGFKFQLGKSHCQTFQTFFSWQIPNSGVPQQNSNQMMMMMMGNAPQKATFTFMGQLLKDFRNNHPYTIMVGKLDSQRKLQAIFLRKLSQNLNLKLSSSLQSPNIRQGLFSFQLIYEDDKTCSQLKLLQQYQQFSYTQKINKNLFLSFDYTHLLIQRMSGWGFGLKSFIKNNILLCNYMGLNQQFNLGYKMPIRKDVKFGANFNYTPTQSTTAIGFQKRFKSSQIQATINTKGQMTTAISLQLLPIFLIKLSGFADYKKQKYSFGYGVNLHC